MNPLIGEIPASLIRSIAARKRPGDIDLGLGEPTLPPDIAPFEAALEWTRRNGSPYSPNAGLPELREAIAGYLSLPRHSGRVRHSGESRNPVSRSPGSVVEESSLPSSAAVGPAPEQLDPRFRGDDERSRDDAAAPTFSAANVCVTIGSEEALYLAIKTVVDPARHEVLIVEPCYLAYPKLCMLEGIRHRMVALRGEEDFRPRASTVLEQLRPDTRLVIINTPCNPTGRIWPAEELQALAAGLAGRDGDPILILTDEVYRELYYGSEPPASVAHYYPQTLVAGSLSKSNALTGLRLGWLAGPEEVVTAAIKVHQFVNTAASTFSQQVAIALFAEPGALSRHRAAYIDARRGLLATAERLCLEMIPPEGAFYALIRLPAPFAADSLRFAERLLDEKRVVTVPGRGFGESAEGWLRISWVAQKDALDDGLARIAEILKE